MNCYDSSDSCACSESPTSIPTDAPSETPTVIPTSAPTQSPTEQPGEWKHIRLLENTTAVVIFIELSDLKKYKTRVNSTIKGQKVRGNMLRWCLDISHGAIHVRKWRRSFFFFGGGGGGF